MGQLTYRPLLWYFAAPLKSLFNIPIRRRVAFLNWLGGLVERFQSYSQSGLVIPWSCATG